MRLSVIEVAFSLIYEKICHGAVDTCTTFKMSLLKSEDIF